MCMCMLLYVYLYIQTDRQTDIPGEPDIILSSLTTAPLLWEPETEPSLEVLTTTNTYFHTTCLYRSSYHDASSASLPLSLSFFVFQVFLCLSLSLSLCFYLVVFDLTSDPMQKKPDPYERTRPYDARKINLRRQGPRHLTLNQPQSPKPQTSILNSHQVTLL